MSIEIRLLGPNDAAVLDRCAEDVFDKPVSPRLSAEFLHDARHHLVVAIDDGLVVGMATGVHYINPDKPPQLFISEVGVSSSHRGRAIGRAMLESLVQRATELGCTEAWVLTDRDNVPARRLYESAGAKTPPDDCAMYTIPIANVDDTKKH